MNNQFPSRSEIKQQLFRFLQTKQGTVQIQEAYEALAEALDLSIEQRSLERSGGPLYKHEIRFARLELELDGLMQSSKVTGRGVWKLVDGLSQPTLPIEESVEFEEGAVDRVYVSRYERSSEARAACLKHHGYSCRVCGFDFAKFYGPLGEGVIHVHHLLPLSKIGRSYIIDPINDLVPLCANCHQMVHRRNPAFTPADLRRLISTQANNEPSHQSKY